MFKYLYLLICFLNIPVISHSQQTRWATDLIGFSSQYTSKEFGAKQVLGPPNAMPAGGSSYVAWSPVLKNEGQEWVQVSFQNPIEVAQIVIAENFNPGCVTRLLLYDENGKEYEVFNNPKGAPTTESMRMWMVAVPRTPYKAHMLRLEMNTKLVSGFNHIDAIGVMDAEGPVTIPINLAGIDFPSKPENLGPKINSAYGEVHPLISPDGQTLYVTRKEHPLNLGAEKRDDIWYSTLDENGEWTQLKNIGEPLNSIGHNYVNSISPDGNMALLGGTYTHHDEGDKLFISYKRADGWTKPEEVVIDNYYHLTGYNSFHQSVDGKTLVMSVTRHDSYGIKDLYVSFRKPDGTYTTPKHMGPQINTAGDEVTPFLAADNKTLYFSSNGFPGYGMNDIYISKRLDDTWTNWSEPQNLGPNINTPNWDAYYTVPANGEFAYFTSYQNSYGAGDIFRIRLEEEQKPEAVTMVVGTVIDVTNNLPVQASVEYNKKSTNENAGFVYSSADNGAYKLVLPAGATYSLAVQAEGYYSVAREVEVPDIKEMQEVRVDFSLYPIREGSIIPLDNIFFASDSDNLQSESHAELDNVVSFLLGNPGIKIEIGGHTNNRCSSSYCKELSKKRARAVRNYITSQGVPVTQITSFGYGKEQPIDTNETEAGRNRNQRVEFKVLEVK